MPTTRSFFIFASGLLVSAMIFVISCSDEGEPMEDINPLLSSTFQIIQAQIFEPNCVSCHTLGTSFATQSNLILSENNAYDQLVGRSPQNLAARADGLELVGTKGLESLDNSYLWEKINFIDFEHYYSDHPQYGELMPIGGPSLTFGELDFIREWIIAGAPETGEVVNENLLDNTERFKIPVEDYQTLALPASGFQLHLGPFDVLPNTERELFYFHPLELNEDQYVNQIEISMREGSHHFILYDYPDGNAPASNIYRDFWDENNNFIFSTALTILNQRFVYGTQWRITDYHFPPGVALRIPSDTGFDLNSHYVNRSNEMKTGEVSVNLHTIDIGEVQYIAKNLFENYTDFNLPPQKVTTLKRSSTFDERIHIFQLTSHAHEHMVEFRVFIKGGTRDGELIYISKDWEHPPLLDYDPPLVLEPGQGLSSEVTYDNNTSRTLRFGLRSKDEMMIVFGAYYTDN